MSEWCESVRRRRNGMRKHVCTMQAFWSIALGHYNFFRCASKEGGWMNRQMYGRESNLLMHIKCKVIACVIKKSQKDVSYVNGWLLLMAVRPYYVSTFTTGSMMICTTLQQELCVFVVVDGVVVVHICVTFDWMGTRNTSEQWQRWYNDRHAIPI